MVCPTCDTYMKNDETECPACGTPNIYYSSKSNYKLIEEISAIHGVNKTTLESLSSFTFLESINDNCIIYMNGIVDPFDTAFDLMTALHDGEAMSEMHIDIAAIIIDGLSKEFKYINGIELYEVEIVQINIYDVLRPDQINGSNHIIILNDPVTTVMQFINQEKLAEWIYINGGAKIYKIFINQKYYDYNMVSLFKFEGEEIDVAAPVVL